MYRQLINRPETVKDWLSDSEEMDVFLFQIKMERNYDELFAEMLMSIDRHTEELDKHSAELTRVSLEVAAERIKSDQAHERLMRRMDEAEARNKEWHDRSKDWEERSKAEHNRHMEMIINTATILDRIIKQNHLKL